MAKRPVVSAIHVARGTFAKLGGLVVRAAFAEARDGLHDGSRLPHLAKAPIEQQPFDHRRTAPQFKQYVDVVQVRLGVDSLGRQHADIAEFTFCVAVIVYPIVVKLGYIHYK